MKWLFWTAFGVQMICLSYALGVATSIIESPNSVGFAIVYSMSFIIMVTQPEAYDHTNCECQVKQ